MLVAEQVVLHGEQQLGAAGVEPAVLAVMRQHLRRFLDGLRLVDRKSSEWHHKIYCAFFSLSARHTRSGVSGACLMRTPVARATAFAMFAAIEFSDPSPLTLVP